jgi:hypothetical protein
MLPPKGGAETTSSWPHTVPPGVGLSSPPSQNVHVAHCPRFLATAYSVYGHPDGDSLSNCVGQASSVPPLVVERLALVAGNSFIPLFEMKSVNVVISVMSSTKGLILDGFWSSGMRSRSWVRKRYVFGLSVPQKEWKGMTNLFRASRSTLLSWRQVVQSHSVELLGPCVNECVQPMEMWTG